MPGSARDRTRGRSGGPSTGAGPRRFDQPAQLGHRRAVTDRVARIFNLHLGGTWDKGGRQRTAVGLVAVEPTRFTFARNGD
jgi:hypothetical protein